MLLIEGVVRVSNVIEPDADVKHCISITLCTCLSYNFNWDTVHIHTHAISIGYCVHGFTIPGMMTEDHEKFHLTTLYEGGKYL